MEPINVLSLFDGMACGRVALERTGIPVKNYIASEVDRYAMQVAMKNYPDIIQIGSVEFVKPVRLVPIDLLIGGSPCQGFSTAGKRLNFSDPRSRLSFEYVRVLKECRKINPKIKFLLENVRMKKEYQDVISKYLGVEPIKINSSLVSAQNRVRLYWTNIEGVEQPEDKGILLKDILEEKVDEKYFMNDGWLKWWDENKDFQLGKKYSSIDPDKAITMTARQYASWNGNFISCERVVGRRINPDTGKRDDYNLNIKPEQRFEPRTDGKSGTLTTVQKDNTLKLVKQLNPSKESGGKQPYQQNRVYDPDGKMPALNASLGGRNNILDGVIRRLTPVECERLQTLPDRFTESVSDTQRYKMLGNGWTVDVVAHILKYFK